MTRAMFALRGPARLVRSEDPPFGLSEQQSRWLKETQEDYLSEVDTRQGSYLAASGTLTQFNAILTGILGAALVTVEMGTLKVAIAIALLLHVLAAFFLFWAVRPVVAEREPVKALAVVGQYRLVDHTFRNYRRGW